MKSLNKHLRFLGGTALMAALPLAPVAQAQDATGIFDVALGKVCWLEGYTNAAATWTVTLRNGDNPKALILQGSGTDFARMSVVQGNPRFVVDGEVRATVSAVWNGRTLPVRLKFSSGAIMSDSGDPALFHTTMGGEDSTDDDWQDLILNATCLHHSG